MAMESLPQLTVSLKLAQSRASSLSTNFQRLLRLVLDEELDALDREIAQVKNGSHETIKAKQREALAECDEKEKIAKTRLIATENEIDVRFAAMVDAEWSRFKVRAVPRKT
jgi:hypothetical protein